MAQINILIAVDGISLANKVKDGSLKSGTVDSPTRLGGWGSSDTYISMIAKSGVAIAQQGQSELSIKAMAGDIIRWTMTTFDGNCSYTAFIYGGDFSPTGYLSSPLTFFNMSTNLHLPSSSDPKSGPIQNYHNHTWVTQSNIINCGAQVCYHFYFKLVDDSTGKVIGYFMWDPFINIAE
nr:AidA/PixA family protein [uncultured Draconibacterium sp.]